MAAEAGDDVHHSAPRCLLGLFDAAAGVLADWSVFDAEAERLSIEVRGFSREDVSRLIESSTFEIPTTEPAGCIRKLATSCGGGGVGPKNPGTLRPTLLLAARRLRWERIDVEAFIEHRAGSSSGAARSDPPLRT
jgi:hypothetical protein